MLLQAAVLYSLGLLNFVLIDQVTCVYIYEIHPLLIIQWYPFGSGQQVMSSLGPFFHAETLNPHLRAHMEQRQLAHCMPHNSSQYNAANNH